MVKPLGGRGYALDPTGESTVLPRPLTSGEGVAAPSPRTPPAVLYSELWLHISKLLDLIMVG